MEVEKPWRIFINLQILWLRESLKEITKRHLVYCERGLFHYNNASYLDPYGAPHKEAYRPTVYRQHISFFRCIPSSQISILNKKQMKITSNVLAILQSFTGLTCF